MYMSLQARKRQTISTGSAFHQTYPFGAPEVEFEIVFQIVRTWLGQGDQIRHILHEDAPLEL